jgi:hypothetical protein
VRDHGAPAVKPLGPDGSCTVMGCRRLAGGRGGVAAYRRRGRGIWRGHFGREPRAAGPGSLGRFGNFGWGVGGGAAFFASVSAAFIPSFSAVFIPGIHAALSPVSSPPLSPISSPLDFLCRRRRGSGEEPAMKMMVKATSSRSHTCAAAPLTARPSIATPITGLNQTVDSNDRVGVGALAAGGEEQGGDCLKRRRRRRRT